MKRLLKNIRLKSCMLLLIINPTPALLQDYEIYTNTWPPYINEEHNEAGRGAKLMALTIAEQQKELSWKYLPYDLSYELIRRESSNGNVILGFPYFKTAQRSKEVLFSDPVFKASTRFYFNRQFTKIKRAPKKINEYRIGRVSGYSYGETLDSYIHDAIIFTSETEAINALFLNNIDLLPMTDSVMTATLERHFPERKQLILPFPGHSDLSGLHVIASRNEPGKIAIKKINASIAALKKANIAGFKEGEPAPRAKVDIARLITVEGYPAILGKSSLDETDTKFYPLPQGTKVLVIEWSEKMVKPSPSDRFYKAMMDATLVVVLNGPHTGKELFVRNMHIELQ